jgi:hypothetical protein
MNGFVDLIKLLNNFTNTFNTVNEDASFNPITFLINRTWENHMTQPNLNLLQKIDSTTDILYPYKINFSENDIVVNATYSVCFINGDNIAPDITINSPNTYPDQISFYCKDDITPAEFITIKKHKTYDISNNTFLGQLWSISFPSNCNVNMVDEMYWRNYNLTIKTIDTSNNIIILYIPEQTIIPSTTDLFEVRNSLGIVSINVISNNNITKQYVTFYNNNFNFIQNETLMQTSKNIYILNQDNIGYYVV